jgi:glycosyltransferase involved in cell wall biosynthesis
MKLRNECIPDIEVSVILPTLNEEETIGTCISKIQNIFQERGVSGEIIVADSSHDCTPEIASSLGAHVIHPKSRGYGNAYLSAFAVARGRIIIIGDADNTYDFLELPLLLKPLEEGADLVIGSRFLGDIKDNSMSFLHRYIGNPLLTLMVNQVFHASFSDTHSGFRAITRAALNKLDLKSGGMEFASEMLISAARAGLHIEEVPITYYPRVTPSKLQSFSDGWRHIRFVLLLKPLPFVAIPGLILSILGLMLMAFFYFQGNVESSHLHTFILGAILMIGGIQVVLTGFLMKTYSVIHGYENRDKVFEFLMNYHDLERFIFLGIVFIGAGMIFGLNIFLKWIAASFGFLSEISTAIISLALIVSGLQIFLFAIFQSMMLLNIDNNHE